ncbi:MAG TPA: tetratricopeptide repeat protein [Eoetvoesiella sp.]
MLQNFCSPLLVIALLAAGSLAQLAQAQTPVAGLEPHVNLADKLSGNGTQPTGGADSFTPGSAAQVFKLNSPTDSPDTALFPKTETKEGGWKGLARLLEALTPGIDTAIPLTSSQITDRISTMLDQGQNQAALDVIEKRMAQLQEKETVGTDVQLIFLHGRALAALERHNEAIEVYLNMTTLYPELPEPWNNLAAEYVKQGKLEMALDAIQMALTANPQYPAAKANLGQIQLMLAQRSFDSAAQAGVSDARAKATETQAILQR